MTCTVYCCEGLVSLPDLSGLAQLEVEYLPDHLQLWAASGYKAGSFSKDEDEDEDEDENEDEDEGEGEGEDSDEDEDEGEGEESDEPA